MSKFVMTSLIAKPIKTTQIFYMITLATKFAFYNILHSFYIFTRHILSKTCDKIKSYNDCTYRKCPTDQSIHGTPNNSLIHNYYRFHSFFSSSRAFSSSIFLLYSSTFLLYSSISSSSSITMNFLHYTMKKEFS